MSQLALERVVDKFGDSVIGSHAEHGDETVIVKREIIHELMAFLRDDPEVSFEMLTDVTCVDYLGVKEPRFEVVYHLYSLTKNHRLRVKVPITEEDPKLASVVDLWKSANWAEREVWDLYGVVFDGHPDLRRVLLYPEFEGHPLRKDYDMEHRQPLVAPREGMRHL